MGKELKVRCWEGLKVGMTGSRKWESGKEGRWEDEKVRR
jgi:hypothetical protein